MGIINNIFKKGKDQQPAKTAAKPAKAVKASEKPAVAEAKKPAVAAVPAKTEAKANIKGKSLQSYRVLVKPLVTEKAAQIGALSKYIFVVHPKLNKLEVRKAIRAVYGLDPIKVNILNVSGKSVRYGRVTGKTKDWKKAVITLKPGEKIEVYEGV